MSRYRVYSIQGDPTIDFAGDELAKYLTGILHEPVLHLRRTRLERPPTLPPGVWLGLPESLGLEPQPVKSRGNPSVFDDSLHVDICPELDGFSGVITGNGPRAVLIGVYRYLTALGCRWLRPGRDGEHVPYETPFGLDARINEEGALPLRGVTLLGPGHGEADPESLLALADWLPKTGCNALLYDYDSLADILRIPGTGPATPEAAYGAFALLGAAVSLRGLVTQAPPSAYGVLHPCSEDPVGIQATRDIGRRVREAAATPRRGLLAHRSVRTAFPTGLPLFAMAWMSWNPTINEDALMEDCMEAAFGPGAARLRQHLEEMGGLFGVLWKKPPCSGGEAMLALHGLEERLETFRPWMKANLVQLDRNRRTGWSYLRQHSDVLRLTAETLAAVRCGDDTLARARRAELGEMLCSREHTLAPVLDSTAYLGAVDDRMKP